jgi:hypothetical protein
MLMKKALALVVLIVTPSIIFAQGTVVFLNNSASLVQQWTSAYDSTPVPVPVGGGYVELIAAPAGTALNPLGVYEGGSGFVPAYSSLAGLLAANPGWVVPYTISNGNPPPQVPAPIFLAPGRFNSGTMVISPLVPGGDADYVVIGWTGPYATYDAAYAADLATPNSSFLGMSTIATTATGNPNRSPPETSVNLTLTFQGITLAPAIIPEPTTVLLSGLGAVLLLLFRRCG